MRRHQAFALPPVRERRFRVYEEAPGFRPGPRVEVGRERVTGPTRRRLLHPVPARRHEPRAATTKTHDAEQTDDFSTSTTSTTTTTSSNEPAEENDGGSGRGLHSPTFQLNLSRSGQ